MPQEGKSMVAGLQCARPLWKWHFYYVKWALSKQKCQPLYSNKRWLKLPFLGFKSQFLSIFSNFFSGILFQNIPAQSIVTFFTTFCSLSGVRFDMDLIYILLTVELDKQNHDFWIYAWFFLQSMGVLGLKYQVPIMIEWILALNAPIRRLVWVRFDHLQKRSILV